MNEFTKEELEEIKIAVGWHYMQQVALYEENNSRIKKIDALGIKLQSMIENYCDHDWKKGKHLFYDIYCTKCSRHFEVTI